MFRAKRNVTAVAKSAAIKLPAVAFRFLKMFNTGAAPVVMASISGLPSPSISAAPAKIGKPEVLIETGAHQTE
jgi:hypothetical protein